MNSTLVIVGLLVASSAFADGSKVLLIGDTRAIVRQEKREELTVTARSISADLKAKQLRCSGAVEIHVGLTVLKATDCVIDLGRDADVFRFSAASVQVTAPVFPSASGAASSKQATDSRSSTQPPPGFSH